MEFVKRFTPKKFIGRYSLEKGAKIVAIIMAVVSIICLLLFLAAFFRYNKDSKCTESILHDIYSFSLNAIIYFLCMTVVHLWFYWGIKKQKASVALSWVVITTMWWLQSVCFVVIMFLVNLGDFSFSWIIGVCFAIIAFLFFAYCILTGYAYWCEVKKQPTQNTTTPANA